MLAIARSEIAGAGRLRARVTSHSGAIAGSPAGSTIQVRRARRMHARRRDDVGAIAAHIETASDAARVDGMVP